MTEADAKTKACFQAATFGASQQLADGPGPHCIGSNCMSWRWSEGKRTAAFLEAVQAHMRTQTKPNFNTAVQAVYADRAGEFARTEGYCGLAGPVQ